MKFKAGYLGVCIVVVSLLATVALGFNLDIDNTTEYRESYKNITNVTGQFDYSEGSEYVAYNPAKNYTGYTSGTLDFTPSSTANQYTYITTPGSHSTTTVNLADSGYYSTNSHEVPANTYTGDRSNWWLVNGYKISVEDVLNHESIDNTSIVGGVTINLLYGSNYTFKPGYVATPNLVTAKASNTYNDVNGHGTGDAYHATDGTTVNKGGVSETWHWAQAIRPYCATNYQAQDFYIHVAQDGTTTVTLNGTVTDVSTADSVYICWSGLACYTTLGGGVASTVYGPWNGATGNYADDQVEYMADNSLTATNMITIEYDVGAVVDYVRISEGVTFLDPSEVGLTPPAGYTSTWDNGKTNGAVTWAISFNDLDTPTHFWASPDINNWTVPGIVPITLKAETGTGTTTVTYSEYNGVQTTVDVGAWNNIQLTFDATNRQVRCTPIVTFNNFQNYTLSGDTFVIQDGFPIMAGITNDLLFDSVDFSVYEDYNDMRFSVTDTITYMGLNKSIFINPSINPRALFPSGDYPILRLTFDSVALLGSSVTINNVTYPVNNGQIIIDNNAINVSGLAVTYYSDGHIYAGKGDRTVDLGASTDNTVSLSGQWYYQARAQSGYLEEVETVDWDVGNWSIDFQQSILIFEGCLVAGILIGRYKMHITTLDWVILIVAGFSGAVLFV